MKQISSCCKSTYTDKPGRPYFVGMPPFMIPVHNNNIDHICDKCGISCTLEDIPVKTEDWEERFSKQPLVLIHNLNDPIYGKENYMAICAMKDFIKSERELWEKELVERIEELNRKRPMEGGHMYDLAVQDIINLIQKK